MGVALSNIISGLAYFNLPADATIGQVRERYYELAKVWHPDLQPSDPQRRTEAEKKIRELNRIYNELESSFCSAGTAGEVDPEQDFSADAAIPVRPIFYAALELLAAPFKMLANLVKATAIIPLTLAAEIPGLVLFAGILLMSAAAAFLLVAGLNYVNGGFSQQPQWSDEQQLAGSLNDWAERKKEAVVDSVRTITPEKSAVNAAPEIIKLVLECDADGVSKLLSADRSAVNQQDEKGDTALAWAAKRGCGELIDPLLRAGADRNSRAENGLRPADWAKRYGFKEIAARLERLN